MPSSLADIPLGQAAKVRSIDGPRAFRRRLLEMGLVPGTIVRVVTIAPLGDPLRIEVRHGQWSIRRNEAAQIQVEAQTVAEPAVQPAPAKPDPSGDPRRFADSAARTGDPDTLGFGDSATRPGMP